MLLYIIIIIIQRLNLKVILKRNKRDGLYSGNLLPAFIVILFSGMRTPFTDRDWQAFRAEAVTSDMDLYAGSVLDIPQEPTILSVSFSCGKCWIPDGEKLSLLSP
jgi:hypothetical protein